MIGLDGGRVQGKEKDEQTGSRWREDKVCTITTYLPGDGREKAAQPLVTTSVATMRDAASFGPMVRVEAERRGVRTALRVLHQNVGYFSRHKNHMRYPEYRAAGWPIGSGMTEAAVKQFNKRVKGTEQFWREERVEPILMLRALWISQDQRWHRYWQNRPAYVP